MIFHTEIAVQTLNILYSEPDIENLISNLPILKYPRVYYDLDGILKLSVFLSAANRCLAISDAFKYVDCYLNDAPYIQCKLCNVSTTLIECDKTINRKFKHIDCDNTNLDFVEIKE